MRLGYVILYVPDVARAAAFYEAAFGLERRFVHESGSFTEMETGSTALAFAAETLIGEMGLAHRRNRPEDEPAGIEVGLVTEDVDAAYRRATAAGAAVVKTPEDKPWGQRVAYVRDLDGCLVELCSPMAG